METGLRKEDIRYQGEAQTEYLTWVVQWVDSVIRQINYFKSIIFQSTYPLHSDLYNWGLAHIWRLGMSASHLMKEASS